MGPLSHPGEPSGDGSATLIVAAIIVVILAATAYSLWKVRRKRGA